MASGKGTSGFGLIFGWRISDHFRGWRWLAISGTWLAIIGGFTMVTLVVAFRQNDGEGMRKAVQGTMPMFLGAMGFLTPIGVAAMASDSLLGGFQDGSAQWVFTKPVERWAYALGILAADTLVLCATAIVPVGALVYASFVLAGGWGAVPALGFAGALLVMALNLAFYIALAEASGIALKSRVMGVVIPLGVLFAGSLSDVRVIGHLIPWDLSELALGLTVGGTLPWYTLWAGMVWICILYTVAVVGVRRSEP